MTASLGNRLARIAVLAAAIAAFLAVHHIRKPLLAGPFGYVLADPDSYQHWGLVRRALDGEGVRIHWMPADNAPFGRFNEWQSPLTILGVAAVRAVETVTGWPRDRALELTGLWFGPILGAAGLTIVAWLGWRAGGWPLAACWLIAWTPAPQVLRVTQMGNTDHHSLHQILCAIMLGAPLAWAARPGVSGGILTGLAGAAAFWSGASELLPAWLLVAALAVWETAHHESAPAAFWRAWWVTGALATFAALLFEFWPQPFHRHLEFLSIWHVALWLVTGALLEHLRHVPPTPRRLVLPLALATLTALLVAGALRGFDWARLHVTQDPRFIWQMTVTAEFTSYANVPFGDAVEKAWFNYGALPVVCLGLAAVARRFTLRTRWSLLAAGFFAVLGFYQMRWETFFAVALILAAGAAVGEWQRSRPLVAVALMAVAALPCWLFVRTIWEEARPYRAQPALGLHGTTFGLDAVARCLRREAPGSIVLAPWDQSGILAGMGGVRTIGTGYWSNLDGLFEAYELLTTDSTERFRELFEKRQIQYLLAREPAAFAGDIAWAFVALHGRVPTRAEIEKTVVWKIADHPHAPVADCPEVRQVVPHWNLIRLR